MFKIKQFIHQYYKTYILTICLLWLLVFCLPWDLQIGGVSIYFFIMKKLFVVFGVLAILFPVLTKKMSLFLFRSAILHGLLDQSLPDFWNFASSAWQLNFCVKCSP